jgi:glycosyltransferase involved in cell wall biosynthesis
LGKEPILAFDEIGLNVAGYLTAELGLGEVARNHLSVLQQLGVPVSVQDASFITHQRKEAIALKDLPTENIYPANLVCINAPEIKHFIERFGTGYFRTKYNIGSWWWEVEDLPPEWQREFYRFDELWVGTQFIKSNFDKVSPIPVHVVQPYVVPLQADPMRESLGFKPGEFVFLFAFDYFSCFERKNPLAIVKAFKQAFKDEKIPVKVLIKTTNAGKFKAKAEFLRQAAGEDPRIVLLDKYCSKSDLNNMIASCDAYISLHRTEGFGLPIAEAMLLNKPVIATGWSGNLDFTTAENSLLVNYGFSVNQDDYGPYKVGMRWAEPDVEHAAKLMRVLYEDQAHAKLLGERGRTTVQELFGREAVSRAISARLEQISRKAYRLGQINTFKNGLLNLECAGTAGGAAGVVVSPAAAELAENSEPTDVQSEKIIDKVEGLFTAWWHQPLFGKPLRLAYKCFARLLQNMLKTETGAGFRRESVEIAFEGVAKLAKDDGERIAELEHRVRELETERAARPKN